MNVFIYYLSGKYGEIRYVGKTKNNIKKRLYSHIKECKSEKKSHKINWIKSLLERGETPKINIIDEVPEKDWEFWEMYWIEQLKQWGFNLTNLTKGGFGANGYKHDSISRKKMKKSKLGIKLSESHKNNISKSVKKKYKESPNYNNSHHKVYEIDKKELYGKYITENLSLNGCADFFGTSETTIFRNLKNYDIKKDEEDRKKQLLSKILVKKVLQYDLNGKFIKEWKSLSEIHNKKGFNKPNIANCCRGVAVTASGFIWRYKDDFLKIDTKRLRYGKRKVKQYDLNGKFIKEYDSISETQSFGYSSSSVQNCCSGRVKSHSNFIWRYSEDPAPGKYKNKSIRPVLQYDLSMKFIKEWSSINSASKSLGVGSNSITTCCKGNYKSAGGFIWRYK